MRIQPEPRSSATIPTITNATVTNATVAAISLAVSWTRACESKHTEL